MLGDNDLFDAQLDGGSEEELEIEEEESLDAIRAAVKQKAKQKVRKETQVILCLLFLVLSNQYLPILAVWGVFLPK